eukprot:TRINITY_DN13688_c0_g1_i2.p1 TRINITY_DN13688_c0_g1~~TRINITY_DN13688_c0_g1_i2.p1  ORF type:complete len:315 (-),score=23.71 TRINITY_DN13688_c0_g1_i2:476-1420(-)
MSRRRVRACAQRVREDIKLQGMESARVMSVNSLEICGDGLNLGMHECDDGNLNDGDGCSRDCRIEQNYECYRRRGEADVCRDVVPPEAVVEVLKKNRIVIFFNELVFPSYSSISLYILGDILKDHIRITIKSIDRDTLPIKWELESKFSSHEGIRGLEITTTIEHNIRGIDELFHIEFDNGVFLDTGQNDLMRKTFDVPARRQLYIPDALTTAGGSFLGLTYATFIVTIGVNPFKSKPPFWIFMSMIQVLSFAPVLNCEIPGNLEMILTTYFSVSKSSIPFESLPSWVPNPKNFIAKFTFRLLLMMWNISVVER